MRAKNTTDKKRVNCRLWLKTHKKIKAIAKKNKWSFVETAEWMAEELSPTKL